jgi:U3 small nucleolar RNA-associated protein 10
MANPALASLILDRCFFQFLLLSKSRKETAKAVWEIIKEAKDGIGAYEVIQGCADEWRWHTDRPGGESIDVMAGANMSIAARMAGQSYLVYVVYFR